ncbi:MAG: response regulator receiver protein [Deltaproteobacteria bacterium]|jgi:CheY-like chemotaxis protein|nr:response regulator receiver protein [Deltaproteobacteria bacterium]
MKKKTVLVVDDEMDMRTFISTLLETSGYRALVATNGEEGIKKAREHKPAVIILDVMMPKEGGVQMYRELKTDEQLKGIPVIMLSAIAKKTFFHSQKMLNTYRGQVVPEPEAYIEKPPETEQLLKVLDDCIGCEKFERA